jgi:Ribbon-helix-helix protein, copG family
MERYIYITLSRRTQITLPDRQYTLLREESARSTLSMAELVRRAIDSAYEPHRRPTLRGYELSLGLWRQPDAAVVGRLEPRRGRSPLD